MPGGAPGLQNQCGARKVPGGFDSHSPPPFFDLFACPEGPIQAPREVTVHERENIVIPRRSEESCLESRRGRDSSLHQN